MEAQPRGGGEMMREYRKGNWTVHETMILIEAKKMDDERRKTIRSKHGGQHQQQPQPQPQQPLRWKWVEEYCWRRGCQRSQNQCNDKWDNLMRDYKKVREYQRNLGDDDNNKNKSYWEMDRAERKEKGLPTNMLPQIYQALYDVVEKPPPIAASSVLPASSVAAPLPLPPVTEVPPVALLPPPPPPPPPPQLPPPLSLPPPRPLLPLPPPLLPCYTHQPVQPPQPLPSTLDSESEYSHLDSHSHSESPAKRRKSRGEAGGAAAPTAGGGTSEEEAEAAAAAAATQMAPGARPTSATDRLLQEVGNAICRSATMISEAIQASEEKQERRHREIVSLHHTSLRLQESSMEVHRQGLSALTDAISNLANSVLHWANSHKNQGPSS